MRHSEFNRSTTNRYQYFAIFFYTGLGIYNPINFAMKKIFIYWLR